MQQLAVMVNGQWRPGIGDPGFMGWLTVIMYMAAAFLCALYVVRLNGQDLDREHMRLRMLWICLGVVLLALGLNKQLDLQSLLTVIGKDLAKTQGWYSQRRVVQWGFIGMVALAGISSLALAGWALGAWWKKQWLALFGAGFLTGFVVIRAASFHHIDELLNWSLAGWRMNWILELGGIACIMIAALINLQECHLRQRCWAEKAEGSARTSHEKHWA